MKQIIVLSIGAAIAYGLTTYFLHPAFQSTAHKDYHYQHCPECGMEMAYKPDSPTCVKCRPKIFKMIPTEKSARDGEGRPATWAFTVAIIVETTALLGCVYYVLTQPKGASRKKVAYSYTKCKHCKQRLRFESAKRGNKGVCPRCKWEITFVEIVDDDD